MHSGYSYLNQWFITCWGWLLYPNKGRKMPCLRMTAMLQTDSKTRHSHHMGPKWWEYFARFVTTCQWSSLMGHFLIFFNKNSCKKCTEAGLGWIKLVNFRSIFTRLKTFNCLLQLNKIKENKAPFFSLIKLINSSLKWEKSLKKATSPILLLAKVNLFKNRLSRQRT